MLAYQTLPQQTNSDYKPMLNPDQGKKSKQNVDPYHDFESNNRVLKQENMTAFEREVERRLGRVGRLKQRVV